MTRHVLGLFTALAGVALVTFLAFRVVEVNAAMVGFAYLLLVLTISTVWGLPEAALASITAAVTFNVFFSPPVGTFTLADPRSGVALFGFLITAILASRFSTEAQRRVLRTAVQQPGLDRLYTLSRAILLRDDAEEIVKPRARPKREGFDLSVIALYERPTEELQADLPEHATMLGAVALLNDRFRDPKSVLFLARDAIMRGDFDAFAIVVADNVELRIRGFPRLNGTWRGREAVVAAMRRHFKVVEAEPPTIERLQVQGDTIILHQRESWIFNVDGRRYDVRSVQTFTFANGKIKTIDLNHDS